MIFGFVYANSVARETEEGLPGREFKTHRKSTAQLLRQSRRRRMHRGAAAELLEGARDDISSLCSE